MADSLYLNLWFRSFREQEVLARVGCVFSQFPFSESRPGIGHLSIRSLDWSEPTVFEETFDHRASPERVLTLAGEFLHDDNSYVFEAHWDLWSRAASADEWRRQPHPVKFIAHGEMF